MKNNNKYEQSNQSYNLEEFQVESKKQKRKGVKDYQQVHKNNHNLEGPQNQPNFYYQKFKLKYQDLNQEQMEQTQLEDSLTEMRNMLRIMNEFINEHISKTYKFLAQNAKEKQVNIYNPQKQIQVLKACLFNVQKKLSIQKIELQHEEQIKRYYEQRPEFLDKLQLEMKDLNNQIYLSEKQTKQKQIQVEKLDLKIIDNVQATLHRDLYHNFNKMKKRYDYHTNQLKQKVQQTKSIEQNLENLKYKEQEIAIKYNELSILAEQKNVQVKENTKYRKLKQKYEQLQQAVLAQKKKKQVALRNQKNNQYMIARSITEMQKTIKQFDLKLSQTQLAILQTIENIQNLLRKNKINKGYLANINNRYLKLEQEKIEQQILQNNEDKNVSKPSLLLRKLTKSLPKQKNITNSINANNEEFSFQDKVQMQGQKRFRLGNSIVIQSSQNKIVSGTQSQMQIFKKDQQNLKISSKPFMKIKKNLKNITDIEINQSALNAKNEGNKSVAEVSQLKPSRFSRLGQKRNVEAKIPQQYMKVLEERGRKILGFDG